MIEKSNDRIPKDEMRLARMIAAAHAKGLRWCSGAAFKTYSERHDRLCEVQDPEQATHVCAIGAMHLAGDITLKSALHAHSQYLQHVYKANDRYPCQSWHNDEESIGYAFRCAMEDL